MTTSNSICATRPSFFSDINKSLLKRGENSRSAKRLAKVRENRLARMDEYVKELSEGVCYKKGERTDKDLNPAKTVQKVLMLLDSETKIGEVPEGYSFEEMMAKIDEGPAGSLAARFPWENAREQVMGWASKVGADLTKIAHAFGLEEESTVVIPSEEETPVETKTIAKAEPKPVPRKRAKRKSA